MRTLPKIALSALSIILGAALLFAAGLFTLMWSTARDNDTVFDTNGNKILADVPGDSRMSVGWVNDKWFGADEVMRPTVFQTITPARKPCPAEKNAMLVAVREGLCSVIVYNSEIQSFRFVGFLARNDVSAWYGDGYSVNDVATQTLRLHGQDYLFRANGPAISGSAARPQPPSQPPVEAESTKIDPTLVAMPISDSNTAQLADSDSTELDDYSNAPNTKPVLFGAVEDSYMPKGQAGNWRSFTEFAKLQNYFASQSPKSNFSNQAYVIRRDDKIVLVKATYQIDDEDWVLFVQYYFRDDGKLEKIVSDLNTFHGNMSVVRDLYFSENGQMTGNVVHYYPLGKFTKELSKPTSDLQDEPVPVYKTTGDLPFKQ